MVEVVSLSNEVLTVLVLLSILGIIGIFVVKLYNILYSGTKFSIQISTVFLIMGVICYLFIEIGLFVSIPSNIDTTLIEYNFYLWFSRLFLILIFVFWFVELLLNVVHQTTEELTRMTKRRSERINRLNRY